MTKELKEATPYDPPAIYMRVRHFPGEGYIWNHAVHPDAEWHDHNDPDLDLLGLDDLIEVKAVPKKKVPVYDLIEEDIRELLDLIRNSNMTVRSRINISGKLLTALEKEGLLGSQF